jgi:antitoxin component HigA of HigAB toxin-antitoxin module
VGSLAVLPADYEDKREWDMGPRAGAHALEYLMGEHGIERAEIAKLPGASQQAVSMILRGERPIPAEHARRLGRRFRVGGGVFL